MFQWHRLGDTSSPWRISSSYICTICCYCLFKCLFGRSEWKGRLGKLHVHPLSLRICLFCTVVVLHCMLYYKLRVDMLCLFLFGIFIYTITSSLASITLSLRTYAVVSMGYIHISCNKVCGQSMLPSYFHVQQMMMFVGVYSQLWWNQNIYIFHKIIILGE